MAVNIDKQLDTVDALVEKENEMVLSQEKLAQQMHDLRAQYDSEGSDHKQLTREFQTLMREHEYGEKVFKNTQARRKLLEEAAARTAIAENEKGNAVPLMRVSDAVTKAVNDKLKKPRQDIDENIVASLEAQGVRIASSGDGGLVQVRREDRPVVMTSNPAVSRSGISNTQDFGTNAGEVRTKDWYGERRLAYGGASKLISMITTDDAVPEKYPNIDYVVGDKAIGVAKRQEGSAGAGDSLPTPEEVTLKPYSMSSGSVELTIESNRDIPAGTLALANRAVSRALKVNWNNELTRGSGATGTSADGAVGNGTGNDTTQGLLQGAGASGEAVTGDDADLTWQALVRLIDSIDPAYTDEDHGGDLILGDDISMGRVGFMFHKSVETRLKLIVDGESRPLWLPNIRGGTEHMILGYDYVLNQSMPVWSRHATIDKRVILFGDFSTYFARMVPNGSYLDFYSQDKDLRERRKVAVNGFMEACGAFLYGFSSGTTSEAVKYLQYTHGTA